MIRQQAFLNADLPFLKGGLHTHTTRSDGRLTPEETLHYVAKHGYDFLSLTDHQIYNFCDYAPDAGVLIIPGMEHSNHLESGSGFRCIHTVCIGPEITDGNGFQQDQKFPYGEARDSVAYQPFLDYLHANNNMTILCHPQWSSTSAKYFDQQQGNFAMEIYNSGCDIENDCDNDAAYWDEILGQGKRWYGVATDDAHRLHHLCKGWIMVKAERSVRAILEALKNGAFYSSCGPEIYDFYVENGKAVIKCSAASRIRLHSDMHPTRMIESAEGDLTWAEFEICNRPDGPYDYVRISVVDKDGKKAWTNPIFL